MVNTQAGMKHVEANSALGRSKSAFFAAVPSPKNVVVIPGGHIHRADKSRIEKLTTLSYQWLLKQEAIKP